MGIGRHLRIGSLVLAALLAHATQAGATTPVGGINFDDNAFPESVLSFVFKGAYQGGATGMGQAVLGANTDTFADFAGGMQGEFVQVGFIDNLVQNGPGDDLAIFEIFVEAGEYFGISLAGGTQILTTLSDTGTTNSAGHAITVAFVDLDDLGVAAGATISSIVLHSPKSVELASFGALNSVTVPEPALAALLLAGSLGLGAGARRR